MSAIQSFFDVRSNYKLQFYFENTSCDLVVFAGDDYDYIPFSKKSGRFVNFMGRLPVVGRVVGPLRAGYGVIKVPACAVAGIFAAISAGAIYPFSKTNSVKCLFVAVLCGEQSLDGIKHIGRGLVETIPVAGCYQFVKYDNDHILC